MDEKERSITRKSSRGSITVEMVIFLPIFLVFFLWIMKLIDICVVQYKIQCAVAETAKEVAAFAVFAEEDGSAAYAGMDWAMDLLGSDGYDTKKARDNNLVYYSASQSKGILFYAFHQILEEANPDIDDYLKRHGVVGGISGIDLTGSEIDAEGRVTVVVSFRVQIVPLPFLDSDHFTKKITCTARTGSWSR